MILQPTPHLQCISQTMGRTCIIVNPGIFASQALFYNRYKVVRERVKNFPGVGVWVKVGECSSTKTQSSYVRKIGSID